MLNLARTLVVCLLLLAIGFGQITPAYACAGADADTDCPDRNPTHSLVQAVTSANSIQNCAGPEADTDCPDQLPGATESGDPPSIIQVLGVSQSDICYAK